MTTRIIYHLVLTDTASTMFELENDNLYVTNVENGIFSKRYDYYTIVSSCSNQIIITDPNISAKDWIKKYKENCVELMADIKDLPREYKLKVLEIMNTFKNDFCKLLEKKFKAMDKQNYTEPSNAKLEGVIFSRETKKTCCYNCQSTEKLRRCSGCLNISYCSKECSKADWSRHKLNCNSK